MINNGAAMKAEEFTCGLHEPGILHESTLPYGGPIRMPSGRYSGQPWKAARSRDPYCPGKLCYA